MLDHVRKHWEKAAAGRTFYDFGDGQGKVKAHRHLNPDGRLGGWVAQTAFASPDATIEDGAVVYGHGQVLKRAWLMAGSTVRGEARVGGPIILGQAVVFENYATCRVPSQVRHPVYLGYDPKSLPWLMIEHGRRMTPDYNDLPEITCREHPVLIHWFEKGVRHRVIYTDTFVIHDQSRRGYGSVESFKDWDGRLHSERATHHNVNVFHSINVKGHFPEIIEGELIWPDAPVKRVGRMPTTVADPKLYMKH